MYEYQEQVGYELDYNYDGWYPKAWIADSTPLHSQWYKISLPSDEWVSGVVIQGRCGKGDGGDNEWISEFDLYYNWAINGTLSPWEKVDYHAPFVTARERYTWSCELHGNAYHAFCDGRKAHTPAVWDASYNSFDECAGDTFGAAIFGDATATAMIYDGCPQEGEDGSKPILTRISRESIQCQETTCGPGSNQNLIAVKCCNVSLKICILLHLHLSITSKALIDLSALPPQPENS